MQRSLSLGAMIVIGLLARAGMGATYTFNKILDSGHSVPNGQAPNFSAVSLAAVDGPSTAFVGSFNDGVASYSGLYRLDSGVITTIADPTVTAPGGGGTFKSVVASGDYSGGIMVFAATTADGTQGLYRYDNGAVSLLIRQGDVLPGGTSTLVSFPARGVAGNATDYAFGAHRSDDTDGMYTTAGGVPAYIADERTRVPGPELGNFVDFPEVHLRDGRTVFIGRSLETDNPLAGVEPAGVFVAVPGNPVIPIAFRGQLIPGGDDSSIRFNEFEKVRIDQFGRIAFTGGWEQEDPLLPPDRHMGVYAINSDGTYKIYADSTVSFPGQQADVFEFWGYTFDGAEPAIGMQDINDESYIYLPQNVGPMELLISSYDSLDGKAISRVRFAGDTIEDGLLTFRATFEDGTSALYTVVMPEPSCFATVALAGVALMVRRRSIP